jgi:hypothetical protein
VTKPKRYQVTVGSLFENPGIDRPFLVIDSDDHGLRRTRRRLTLDAIEAREDGRDSRPLLAQVARIRDEQLRRFQLRMRYQATDRPAGTDEYDRYYRHGEPPSYRLAYLMDATNAWLGHRHILPWQVAS